MPRLSIPLSDLPLFNDISRENHDLLQQEVVRKQCAESAVILHKGQQVSGAYVVLTGRLRVFSLFPSGTEATLYSIEPGETCVLALNCLFNDLLYPAWVQAEIATEVAVIPGALYRKLFERETAVQNLTVNSLSTLVFRLMGELEQLHTQHHRQRLANFLLLRASSAGVLEITQQQLAQHLGTSREVITRLLQKFAAKAYVRTGRGVITLLNIDGLRQVASSQDQQDLDE